MDVKGQVRDILVSLLKVRPEEIKDDVRLYDAIGIDSTEMVEAVIALEKSFNTKLSPKEITKFSTVNDIERLILSKINP